MDPRMHELWKALEEKGAKASAEPPLPELLPGVQDFVRPEATAIQARWTELSLADAKRESKLAGLARALAGPAGVDVIIGACDSASAQIERLLRDGDAPGIVGRLERQAQHSPYLEVTTRRSSRLARMNGWSSDDSVTVRVPAEAFAQHMAMRTGTSPDWCGWLWDHVYDEFREGHVALFPMLSIEESGDGAILVSVRGG